VLATVALASLGLALAATGAGGLGAPAAPLTGTSVLVSGLPSCPVSPGFNAERVGPGAPLDDGKYLFVADECNGTLYRLPTTGGSAAHALKAKTGMILAFAKLGTHYFAARYSTDSTAGLWEFDPTTLAWKSSAPAVPLIDIRGVAVDPKTHDVFLSSDQKIVRVHNLTGKKPVVTTFVTGSGGDLFDALAFNASGSILYVTDRYNYPNIHVVGFNRAGKSVLDVVDPYQGEGLAVAKNGVLFINNNGTNGGSPATYGSVSTLAPNATTLTTVASGGTRGGFAAVDCKGYMLVDQSGTVVKLSPALFPANAGAGKCSSSVKHA
jgi:hypothetical protein